MVIQLPRTRNLLAPPSDFCPGKQPHKCYKVCIALKNNCPRFVRINVAIKGKGYEKKAMKTLYTLEKLYLFVMQT